MNLLFIYFSVRMEGNTKVPSHEYLAAFLKMHGLLYSHAELDKAEILVNMLTSSLTPHIATESLSGWKLVQVSDQICISKNL